MMDDELAEDEDDDVADGDRTVIEGVVVDKDESVAVDEGISAGGLEEVPIIMVKMSQIATMFLNLLAERGYVI